MILEALLRAFFCGHQVAGNLLGEKPVERLVLVEGLDHVVAIAKRVGKTDVLIEPVGIGVASNVEPMSPPAFPVPGRRQQPVDR